MHLYLPSKQRTSLAVSMVLKPKSSILKRVGFRLENTDEGVGKKSRKVVEVEEGKARAPLAKRLRVTLVSLRMQQIQVCVRELASALFAACRGRSVVSGDASCSHQMYAVFCKSRTKEMVWSVIRQPQHRAAHARRISITAA